MIYSRLIATGSYLPKRILTNKELEQMVDTSDEWIRERTGIIQRHIASDDETTSSMAYEASLKAFARAQISPQDLDMIIVATSTPDTIMPSIACHLQDRLGLTHIPAFDVGAACAGFTYALSVADQFIRTGAYKTILVVGSEVMSRILDWTDRSTCILFADGAGAAILTADNEPGIHVTKIHAAGQYKDILGASQAYQLDGTPRKPILVMHGSEVFKFAVTTLSEAVDETLNAAGFTAEQVDWLVPHQANLRIIQAVGKKLSLPTDKIVVTVHDHGNTSSASIPLALDTAVSDGRIKKGDRILLESFGAGFTWGSAFITF